MTTCRSFLSLLACWPLVGWIVARAPADTRARDVPPRRSCQPEIGAGRDRVFMRLGNSPIGPPSLDNAIARRNDSGGITLTLHDPERRSAAA